MFELTWNSFPLKLNEGPSLRYGHVPQRESLHFVTDFCDVVILEAQSIYIYIYSLDIIKIVHISFIFFFYIEHFNLINKITGHFIMFILYVVSISYILSYIS